MPDAISSTHLLWAAFATQLLLGFVCTLLSTLLDRSGPIRLAHWVEESGGSIQRLWGSQRGFDALRLVLASFGKLLPLTALSTTWWGLTDTVRPAVLGTVLLVVGAGEWVGRRLVAGDREGYLRKATTIYRVMVVLLAPLYLTLAATLPRRRQDARDDPDEDEASDQEIEAFIEVGSREGILEPEEEALVWRIVDFGDAIVRKVMTPRIDIVGVSAAATLEEVTQTLLDSNRSRLPVYESSIDHVAGVLHIRDLLAALHADPRPTVLELCSPAYVVPEKKLISELLRELQARHLQMAIVVDEYGGTAGLVTVEDVLEEIVGEIADEHDGFEPEPESLENGGWRMHGGTHLELLDELFEVEIEDTQFETLGGLIFDAAGKVPSSGDRFVAYGLEFEVESMEDRRVGDVLVRASRAEAGVPRTASVSRETSVLQAASPTQTERVSPAAGASRATGVSRTDNARSRENG